MKPVQWGILSTAKIGMEKVIPAMQSKAHCHVVAIASRNADKARRAAARLGISKSYGSYEELLADPEIDAVFNPLPNHLHLAWSVKALEAGKHVLCEKPLTMNAAEARQLNDVARKHPGLKVMEAFMYRFHTQWQYAKRAVDTGALGEIRTIQSFFAYHNVDPNNIRNIAATGGGALLDIGCYCISLSRFIYGSEPTRVLGTMEFDPVMQTDRHISGILDFSGRTATYSCSTQMQPCQRVHIVGTSGRIEIEIPFNAPLDAPCKIWVHTGKRSEEKLFEVCNQYEEQGKAFCEAILRNTSVPTPLEDAIHNMQVIDAIRQSAGTDRWVSL